MVSRRIDSTSFSYCLSRTSADNMSSKRKREKTRLTVISDEHYFVIFKLSKGPKSCFGCRLHFLETSHRVLCIFFFFIVTINPKWETLILTYIEADKASDVRAKETLWTGVVFWRSALTTSQEAKVMPLPNWTFISPKTLFSPSPDSRYEPLSFLLSTFAYENSVCLKAAIQAHYTVVDEKKSPPLQATYDAHF